jgi:hypothetical protein
MNIWPRRARYVPIAALLLVAAYSDDGPRTADDAPVASTIAQAAPPTETSTADPADDAGSNASNGLAILPTRDGPQSETTGSVPHIQINTEPVPEVDAELRRRVFLLPDVEERESQLSLPGARSLWLADNLELARPEVLQLGREFGHFHPNGSLHLWLPVERAKEVAETKWGELHPWVDRENFWDGVAMIYIPETLDEVGVALQLVVDAFNYIAGANLDPASFD